MNTSGSAVLVDVSGHMDTAPGRWTPTRTRTRDTLIRWMADHPDSPVAFEPFFRAASPFSNFHPAPFVVDGIEYPTSEHWVMAAKARLFGDIEHEQMAISAPTPKAAKAAGRKVRGFDQAIWNSEKRRIMFEGVLAKFTPRPDVLLATGNRILVEASPFDRIWGAGIGATDPRINNPAQWPGQNLLGFILMDAREFLATAATTSEQTFLDEASRVTA